MSRPRLLSLRCAFREWEAVLRRALGLPSAPALVYAIRCPHCGEWVKPRRFDLRHMACKTCVATLARPRRTPGAAAGSPRCNGSSSAFGGDARCR